MVTLPLPRWVPNSFLYRFPHSVLSACCRAGDAKPAELGSGGVGV